MYPCHMKTDQTESSAPAATPHADTPVSAKIRERLLAARQRFHANDNISAFIQPGELEQLLNEVEAKMQSVLDSLVIDTANDHNTDKTARRVAKMYLQEVIVEIMRSTTRNEADGMTFIIHTLHGWMAGRYLFVQFMTVQKKNYIRRKLNSRPTQIS